MSRLSLLFLMPCFVYVANLSAQSRCCDNNYKGGNTALNAKNYSKAIELFTDGSRCGDKCGYDFTALIKQAKAAEKAAAMVKIKPKVSEKQTKPVEESWSASSYPTPSVTEPEMIQVTGGTFKMGSNKENDEKPIHSVSLSSFYIGKFEVTQAQWRWVMGVDPPQLNFKGCDNCPVERVSWNDIQDFIQKLNAKTGKTYRLPTEEEWEFASRGGVKSNGYTYSGSNSIGVVAWYTDNSDSKTHQVGRKKPNELGLYDMSGNVWEWCEDWFKGYYGSSGVSDLTGSGRVVRGGGWGSNAEYCRSTYRSYDTPTYRNYGLGFRLAISSLQ